MEAGASMAMQVRPLDRPGDPDAVLALAWEVGRPHPQWVPYYLREERRRLLRHQFRYFTERGVRAQGFGAFEGARLVATASAHVDPPLQAHLDRPVGLLGQFESLQGVDVTPLLDAAHEWLAGEGAREVWAPANCPFQIEGGGVLTEGGGAADRGAHGRLRRQHQLAAPGRQDGRRPTPAPGSATPRSRAGRWRRRARGTARGPTASGSTCPRSPSRPSACRPTTS